MKAAQISVRISAIAAIAVLVSVVGSGQARGATLVVTTTNDTGPGSLRQAILSANLTAGVADVIEFDIAGAGPHTIEPATPLPAITDRVVIDGYSQPGASPNTLSTGDDAVLNLVVLDTLVLDTTNSTVRGLAIRQIQVGSVPGPNGSNVIEGCFIGLDATGTNSLGSAGFGVFVQTPGNRIGGTTPSARNLISGAGTTGIEIFETFATGNVVQGNFIGTDRTGTKAIGNVDRALVINMNASGNTIGGTAPGAGNVISGNLDRGITLDGANNVVQGNFVGTDLTGLQPLGNARSGIEIGGPDNLIGGTNSAAANIIAFNGVGGNGFTTNGIDIKPGATGYAILGNSIFDNEGLGIDVNADGLITAGFPVLTLVSNNVVRGTHTPNTTFRLELFVNPVCDPSGHGEGRTFLGATNVITDGTGNFALIWPAPFTPGLSLTATADGNTEFSACRMATAPTGANSWTSNVSGKWEEGANWSLNAPPYVGHSLIAITNASTKTVHNDAATATGFPTTLTISNLLISAPGGATNTLLLAHGGTDTPLRVLRDLTLERGGALTINNAALRLDGPFGTGLKVDGSATLNEGQLISTNDGSPMLIGNNGPGALTVSNGTLQAYAAIVGAQAGADGEWHIAGGNSSVNTYMDIADSLTATGMVRVTGGQLSVPTAYIGLFGDGRLIVTDGVFQCAGQGLIASQDGARGSFTAAGGTSTFGNILIGENATAIGAVLVTGTGWVQVNGALDNRGSVTVEGGSFNVLGQVESIVPGNSVRVTGGRFTATNDNAFLTQVTVSNGTFLARDVFLGNQVAGIFTMAAGLVELPGSFNGFNVGVNGGTGTVWQVGGEINLPETDLNVGGLFSPAIGYMTLSNGVTRARTVFVGGQGDGTGTFTMAGGTLAASNLVVNTSSRFIFNKGLLEASSVTVAGTLPFVVGDGAGMAQLELQGGTSVLPTGLRIASQSLLTGSGTVVGNVTNSGVIAPGTSAGRIDITGNLVLSNSSELRLDVGGYTPGTQFDFIRVNGNARLGGNLSVSVTNGFQTVLTNGATFTVLTNNSPLVGSFANVASGESLTTVDAYARFTVLYAGDTTVRLLGFEVVDTDEDGLPDWWEDQFDLDKNDSGDALGDLDGDGQSNLDEFGAGTLPNDADSVFRIVAIQGEANNLRISWTTVGGKSYRVQTNAPTINGSFTNNFANASPVIAVAGSGESTTNYLHTGGALGASARYYRIRVEP